MDVLNAAVRECNLELFETLCQPMSPIQDDVFQPSHDLQSHKMEASSTNGFNLRACFDDTHPSSETRPGCLVLGVRYDDKFVEQFELYYKLGGIKKHWLFKCLSRLQVFQVQRGYICIQTTAPAEVFKTFENLSENEVIVLPVSAMSVLLNFFKTVWPKLVQTDKCSPILATNNQKAFVTRTFAVRTQYGLSKQHVVTLFQFKKQIKIILRVDPVAQTAVIEATNDKKMSTSWSLYISIMEDLAKHCKIYDDFLLAYKSNKTTLESPARVSLEHGKSETAAETSRGYVTSHDQTIEKLRDMAATSGIKRTSTQSNVVSKRNK